MKMWFGPQIEAGYMGSACASKFYPCGVLGEW
jgi:hypothetical protein